MRKRAFELIEVGSVKGESYLTKPGAWHIVSFFEEERPKEGLGDEGSVPSGLSHGGGLSYLAASHWAAELSDAVERFVKENKTVCTNCKGEWIKLSTGVLDNCIFCGELLAPCNEEGSDVPLQDSPHD